MLFCPAVCSGGLHHTERYYAGEQRPIALHALLWGSWLTQYINRASAICLSRAENGRRSGTPASGLAEATAAGCLYLPDRLQESKSGVASTSPFQKRAETARRHAM